MERQQYLGAAPYQHSPQRRAHGNGYKPKTLSTRLGEITFDIPQVREGGFCRQALEKGLRSERALHLALAEMYGQGVANRLLPGSYVSLQSALAFYGMIPEYVPVTTSVTSGRPSHWEPPLGAFDLRHIQIDFFDGYRFVDLGENQQAFIANPEKALLDLVYLEPGGDEPDYLADLRLNNLGRLDWQLLERLARKLDKPKLMRAMAAIQEMAGEEAEFESL